MGEAGASRGARGEQIITDRGKRSEPFSQLLGELWKRLSGGEADWAWPWGAIVDEGGIWIARGRLIAGPAG